jgi:iron complex transport system substrate-binding protein
MSENANTVISSLKKTIDDVSGIAGATNKRVFVALSADPSPWTAGNSTFMSDIVSTAGGRNIFDSQSSGWFMVSKEQIYAKQPQVLIIFSEKEVKTEEEYKAILDSLDPVWKSTPAYKAEEKEVYVFSANSADILSRPGPRLAEATELICKILNQEAFMQRDPMDAIPHFFGNDYTDYLTYQGEPLYG